MGEKLLYKIHIRGYVQGVGFRWSASREARMLGITGYVKNMSDGSVYIEAEGSDDDLREFIEWCKTGPRAGYVETMETEKHPAVGYLDFRIEH